MRLFSWIYADSNECIHIVTYYAFGDDHLVPWSGKKKWNDLLEGEQQYVLTNPMHPVLKNTKFPVDVINEDCKDCVKEND